MDILNEMYRFRSIDNLLDKYQELENQEIYFASPEELNDPVEGFKDIYWKGDSVVWRNLLKHYLRCLEHIYSLTIILDEEKVINSKDIPVNINSLKFPTTEYREMFKEILDIFFKTKFLSSLPKDLEGRISPIRRGELLSYLKLIHLFAIEIISEVYRNHQILPKSKSSKNHLDEFRKLLEKTGSIVLLTNRLEQEHSSDKYKNIAELFYSLTNMVSNEVQFISQYSNAKDIELNSNKFFLLSEFPEQFLQRLESLVYPDWFSASFMRECTNSSVWGHYGENHKGVCLIFNTINNTDKIQINLETEHGYSNNGPIIGMIPHSFQKVKYENKHVSIDFFRSLGRASVIQLEHQWYMDEFGNKSECGEHLRNNQDEWRNNYWENFQKSLTTKLDDWQYEKEYRLIINDGFIDYQNKNNRKLKYDFSSLKGIIFGIKTSNSDKMRILKIVEEKCKKNNRKEFDFYQTFYSQDSGKIEKQKLNLLKFE